MAAVSMFWYTDIANPVNSTENERKSDFQTKFTPEKYQSIPKLLIPLGIPRGNLTQNEARPVGHLTFAGVNTPVSVASKRIS